MGSCWRVLALSSIGTRDGDRPAEIVVTIILNYSGG